ncbi:MAG: TlpA family protein disulfide reductase [Candidatus Firestonebacteria bacterium]|nr:TlpA family protein disulfide reductase [Candidatus Firestonebacteria bacterium]
MLKRIAISGLLMFLLAGCRPGGHQPESGVTTNTSAPAAVAADAQVFPDFKVKGFDNQEISLSQYRGKIVILDLFATWCPPCRMEIPHFVALQQAYAGKLAVVGLSYDQGAAKDVLAFAKNMKINYDIYWGSEEIARFVGMRGIPHTLVLDAQGHVVKTYVGYQDKAVFEKDIQDLLGKAL